MFSISHYLALQEWLFSSKAWFILPVFGFFGTVAVLRLQRMKSIERLFHYPSRASFAKMTLEDASAIQCELVELEFPMIFLKALEFALFKVRSSYCPLGNIAENTCRPMVYQQYPGYWFKRNN